MKRPTKPPHYGSVSNPNTFHEAFNYLSESGPKDLKTNKGAPFTAESRITKKGKHVGENCIWISKDSDSRAYIYECCWGHITNCHGVYIDVYSPHLYRSQPLNEEAVSMDKPKTCLDCGFLSIRGREIVHSHRKMLEIYGRSGSLPGCGEETDCFKGMWESHLDYAAPNYDMVFYEIEIDRKDCSGFMDYENGFTPAQHLEFQIEKRKEDLKLKIAKLGFCGALLGGAVGTAIFQLVAWLYTNSQQP